MNPKDELIRRAMLHARYGYALGGKPGESAAAQAEANRGVSSGSASSGNVGGVRDGGFGGAGVGSLGGNGGMGPQMSNVGAKGDFGGDGGSGGPQTSNVDAKSDFGTMAPQTSNLAAKSDFNSMGLPTLGDYVSPSPDIGMAAFNRAMEASYNDMPNLTGTSVPVGVLEGIHRPAQAETIKPSIVDFATAATNYGTSLPIKNPKTLSEYMGSNISGSPSYGPLPQQVMSATKGDFLGMPADRRAPVGTFSGFDTPQPPAMDIGDLIAGLQQPEPTSRPVMMNGEFFSSMPSLSRLTGNPSPSAVALQMGNPTFSTGPRTQVAAIAPSLAPSIGSVKAADYQAIANSIKGYSPEQKNQIAFGSAYSTNTPTKVGNMIASLSAAASNPNLSAAQRAQMSKDIEALRGMGGIAVSPGSSFAPTPQGFTVNPTTGAITKSPGYNVVAGPYPTMESPVGTFENISFAMPKSVALSQRGIAANPNFAQMTSAPETQMAQAPQGITGAGFNMANNNAPVDLTGLGASPPLEAPRYLREPQMIATQFAAPASAPVQTATVAQDPVARALALTSNSQNFARGMYANDGRQGDGVRPPNAGGNPTKVLLGMGYTPEQIAAMTPEEIQAIIDNNTAPAMASPVTEVPVAAAAYGGRIGYKKGGETSTEAGSVNTGPKEPITLQPLPEWKPYAMPQYTMPAASPMISNFMGSLSQPIPPVQMPQYQSMGTPLQNPQATFANPEMGSSGTLGNLGVNAMRYNPMLMSERPDYALAENNSLANAFRLMRG